jgi:general secretion pathway protein C
MGRYLSWLANSVLFVLCCYLVADTANEVFAALLTPKPEDATPAPTTSATVGRAWENREIILKRNLFNASLLAPPVPVAEPVEELEETQLPLKLIGTAASIPPEHSWAAVKDETERQTSIVRVNDQLNTATVQRIERRRIVLSESGVLRELVLDEDSPGKPGVRFRDLPRRRPAVSPRRTARGESRNRAPPKAPDPDTLRKLAENRFQVERNDVDDLMQNPTNLFSQARILPKYEEGEMVGLQINAIKPGSLFEEIGIESGDVITKLNGIAIDNPQESAKVLAEFSEAESFTVDVERGDGTNDTLEFSLED